MLRIYRGLNRPARGRVFIPAVEIDDPLFIVGDPAEIQEPLRWRFAKRGKRMGYRFKLEAWQVGEEVGVLVSAHVDEAPPPVVLSEDTGTSLARRVAQPAVDVKNHPFFTG